MKDCCKSGKKDKKCYRKSDKKTFKLPRKYSKKSCKNIRGFTMRSSCTPYKDCDKKGGGKGPLTENKDMYYKICHNNTKYAEPKHSGKYSKKIYKKGIFICPNCNNELYDAKDMYDSKTGWPAFSKPYKLNSVKYNSKSKEITCYNCGLHLGHRTYDGPTDTKIHDCINSVCIHLKDNKSNKNIKKKKLKKCSVKPLTGYKRSGYCETDMYDKGSHLVCAKMTDEFLRYTKSKGNDLSTPRNNFPGLKKGDKWCLCQDRWLEAINGGIKIPIVKSSTNNMIKPEVREKIKKINSAKGGGKSKKQFLFNPNNPKKSFDVYIDKDPSDTIPIKYTTIQDVKNTIKKLERLFKQGKYPHKRIWQVGMIMRVRLKVLKKKKPNEYKLAERYFKFLGQRTKLKTFKERKKYAFKF